MNSGNSDYVFGVFWVYFVIFYKLLMVVEPSDRTFRDPAFWQNGPARGQFLDDVYETMCERLNHMRCCATIARVTANSFNYWIFFSARAVTTGAATMSLRLAA